jgi:DNA-binding NtrC family response regulator
MKVPGTILLVDDDLLVLRALRRDLEGTGYNLLISQSVASAMQALETEKIDVVISDYNMPGPNGLDLLAHISREYPQIVRMMLTGHAGLEMALAAINAGHVYHMLTKPWEKTELISAADRCFHLIAGQVAREEAMKPAVPLKHRAQVGELEMQHPGISQVIRQGGAIYIEDDGAMDADDMDLESLLRQAQ